MKNGGSFHCYVKLPEGIHGESWISLKKITKISWSRLLLPLIAKDESTKVSNQG